MPNINDIPQTSKIAAWLVEHFSDARWIGTPLVADIMRMIESHQEFVSIIENWNKDADAEASERERDLVSTIDQLGANMLEIVEHEERQRAEARERRFPFNHPGAQADFPRWSRKPSWTLDEAIALSFGRDPGKVTWAIIEKHLSESSFAKEYAERRDIALRAAATGEIDDPIRPGRFLEWTSMSNIDLPDDLIDAIATYRSEIVDWKSAYEAISKRRDEMEAEVAALRQVESQKRDLGTREQDSLLKLAIGMAIAGYKFDPKSKKNKATSEIYSDLEKLGIPLDEGTILKWLRAGAELVPRENEAEDKR